MSALRKYCAHAQDGKAMLHNENKRELRIARLAAGPTSSWLTGSIHAIRLSKQHLQYQKWTKEYGGFFGFIALNVPFLVASKPVVAWYSPTPLFLHFYCFLFK